MANDFVKAPSAASVKLLDFDQAKVISGIIPGKYVLVVSGKKPYANMIVALSPLIYIRRPEYWGIEVVGSLPGIGLPAVTPYVVAIPLDGITGTKGIEVIGAKHKKRINVGKAKPKLKAKTTAKAPFVTAEST